jgi:hypothetical protein
MLGMALTARLAMPVERAAQALVWLHRPFAPGVQRRFTEIEPRTWR